MDYSLIANLPNLSPGTTSPDVEKLQEWLVANGFMTQAQMSTGAGIYGPKTTAAVAAWQQQAGIDTAGNPGYFGPISKTYIQSQTSSATPTPPPPSTTTPTTPTTSNPTPTPSLQQALLSAVADVATSAAATGKPPVSFADALTLASKDPTIVAKYADMMKLDTQAFTQTLDQARQAASTEQQLQKTQFENERKQLAESSAAAGRAYSGFRGKAQQDLAQSESGIVQSSRATLQKNLQDLTTAFESKYGSAATVPATATFTDPTAASTVGISGLATTGSPSSASTLAGQTAGGITGSVAPAKSADVNASALNSYQIAQFPAV